MSAGGDGDVIVWESSGSLERDTAELRFDEVQRICMDFQMQNAVAITQLPGLEWCANFPVTSTKEHLPGPVSEPVVIWLSLLTCLRPTLQDSAHQGVHCMRGKTAGNCESFVGMPDPRGL